MNAKELALPALAASTFLLSLLFYLQLPERIPTHWGPGGAADAFGPKYFVFTLPAAIAFVYALYLAIPRIEVYKKNLKAFESEYFLLFLVLEAFLSAVFLSSLIQIYRPFNMNYFMLPSVAILLYAVGELVPRMKRNFFVGIRTPWTLSSDAVWKKTHEAGGKAFKAAAAISLIGLLFIDYAIYFILLPVLAAAAYQVVYSYLEFQKLAKRKR